MTPDRLEEIQLLLYESQKKLDQEEIARLRLVIDKMRIDTENERLDYLRIVKRLDVQLRQVMDERDEWKTQCLKHWGYQPTGPTLDPSNPPQGGSGIK